jgi:hypothetical protein
MGNSAGLLTLCSMDMNALTGNAQNHPARSIDTLSSSAAVETRCIASQSASLPRGLKARHNPAQWQRLGIMDTRPHPAPCKGSKPYHTIHLNKTGL